MSLEVGASARIGAPGVGIGAPGVGDGRPAGLQHALAAGAGVTLCGIPREQLHVFALTFPHQIARSCTVCLRALARARAS